MPESYPRYPSHELVLEYLRSYTDHFELRTHTRFAANVTRIEPEWTITLDGGETRRYAGVVPATGHDRILRRAVLPGDPKVETIHSSAYRDPAQLAGRRVPVVRGGQSAADVLTDSAMYATSTLHSTRCGF
ncbi:hypothetical protein Ssi02_51110 [Sinosporangium siamense]|uniref:Uncharacterized protein n=2 Tax=Sinosporangium siamense TaxID=1367973 RepID=A0A919RL74_9ACTN|nr:hypothetical protein Ssi02_51110 [Sinosporangium siamense]